MFFYKYFNEIGIKMNYQSIKQSFIINFRVLDVIIFDAKFSYDEFDKYIN